MATSSNIGGAHVYDMEFEDPTMTTWTLLRQTWTAITKVSEAKLTKLKLTPEKLAILWTCRDFPGTVTPAEISRLLFREPQSIAGVLNRMEKEGLVKRIPKRKGRPYTEIVMTPKGEQLCSPGIEVHKAQIKSLTSDMSDEDRQHLHRILKALRQKMLDEIHMDIESQPPELASDKPIPLRW
jgi:DNA-binding MarR family transcriptional regulator